MAYPTPPWYDDEWESYQNFIHRYKYYIHSLNVEQLHELQVDLKTDLKTNIQDTEHMQQTWISEIKTKWICHGLGLVAHCFGAPRLYMTLITGSALYNLYSTVKDWNSKMINVALSQNVFEMASVGMGVDFFDVSGHKHLIASGVGGFCSLGMDWMSCCLVFTGCIEDKLQLVDEHLNHLEYSITEVSDHFSE